jgi:GntR family transcriptional repressor for pyruvate dehydrogenase complex
MPDDESGPPDAPWVIAPSDAVLVGVGDAILRGELRPGVEVPSEAALTHELRISRSRARRALATLGSAGILKEAGPAPGTGSSGRRELAETAVDGIGRMLRLVLLDRGDVRNGEILGVRTALERVSAAGAALAADAEDIAELTAIVQRMHDPGVTTDEFRNLDTTFHMRIARASGSGLSASLLHGLSDAIAGQMQHAFSETDDWTGTARRLAEEHGRLSDIIRRRMADDAADFVETHVHDFYARR